MTLSRLALALTLACSAMLSHAQDGRKAVLSDQQVRQQIIEESIAAYPGRCPCPFNSAKNGSACGGRSAWSKRGGYAPICYEREVTQEMVQRWRAANSR